MAAKQDIQRGISADVRADRDAVVAACWRAAEAVGKHARIEANAAKVTVAILPGASQKFSTISPVVGIHLRPAAGNRVHLDTRVEQHRTVQSRMFGFIPAGPKRLVGRQFFFRFLDALETELGALDPATGLVQRRDFATASAR